MKKESLVTDSSKMQSVLSTEFREDIVWYHIKLKASANNVLSKTTFWLGANSEEDIYKILKKKHKINKKDVEWIKQETPPFIGE